jgi:hypothetical protein
MILSNFFAPAITYKCNLIENYNRREMLIMENLSISFISTSHTVSKVREAKVFALRGGAICQ